MARPRKTQASAWAKRNARARALGYRNYYDYRAHGYGSRPAAEPAFRGEKLRQLRGHASGADLAAAARPGDLIVATMGSRDSQGRYRSIDILLVGADGDDQEFQIRQRHQLTRDYLTALVADLEAAGAIFSPAPSLDLRRIADEASDEEDDDDLDEDEEDE